MKNFNEWMREQHPDFQQIDEVHPWLKTAALLGASAAAGIGGEEARKAAYEPHNSIIPSVRHAAYDRMAEKEDAERKAEVEGREAFLRNAIEKFERGEPTSREERMAMEKSGYHLGVVTHDGRRVPPDPTSQGAIAKRQGKTLVWNRGDRVYPAPPEAGLHNYNFAPLNQQDPEIQDYYAKHPERFGR